MSDQGKTPVGASEKVSVILLDDQLKNAHIGAAWRAALQFSGYTHGGMIVRLEPIFGLAKGDYALGRYYAQGMTRYVNNGTALWPGLALRLVSPPN